MVRRRPPPRVSGKGKIAPVLLSVSEELGIGFLAGVASRAVSTPLSVITVRLQTESEDEETEEEAQVKDNVGNDIGERKERGVGAAVQRVYAEDGLKGFWSGTKIPPSFPLAVLTSVVFSGFTTTIPLSLNPAITLFLFQLVRRVSSHPLFVRSSAPATRSDKLATPSASASFLGAACSNAVATLILYPLILAKTRLQIHRKSENAHTDLDMWNVWKSVWTKDGMGGIYKGLDAQILKGFVSQGVTMLVKQR